MKTPSDKTVLILSDSEKHILNSALLVKLKQMRSDISSEKAHLMPIEFVVGMCDELDSIEKLLKQLKQVKY